MTLMGTGHFGLYLCIVLICAIPLGWYIAQVYQHKPCGLHLLFSPVERFIYRLCAISPKQEMNWKHYLFAMLIFNLLGLLLVYMLQRLQGWLPLNPQTFSAVAPDLAWNTAASFSTNTNWQAYSGESTLSYFTQMLALTVQNFLSAATGMSLLVALIRGLKNHETTHLGNFWVDTTRGILYILLPLSLLLALALTSQGVIQNFKHSETITLLQPMTISMPIEDVTNPTTHNHQATPKMIEQLVTTQTLPMGPVASQVAIKQLGSNGGGYFNTNSAHPLENPTPLSNFLEMLAILLIPAALCYSFGIMIADKRQGLALLATMMILFIPATLVCIDAEQQTNPAITALGLDHAPQPSASSIGNMEGKETRFGIVNSAIWAAATTATANGSINAMHDSFTPLGSLIPLWFMHSGEVIFGGVGSGLYGMLMLVIITVFIAGLMVGRTPEYLGKKIEPFEMKMASFAVLIMPLLVLLFTAIAVVLPTGTQSIANPGMHGFTEILYAFTSMANNNGSAFAGLNANTPFYNLLGGLALLFGRYWIAIPTLAIAGSLAKKKAIPSSVGTLSTHSPFFIFLLICIILILAALSFLPALALGPVVEHLYLWGNYVH